MIATTKPKTCQHCGTTFHPVRSMQAVCSAICAMRKVKADKADEKKQVRVRKEAIARLPELIKTAQRAFNEFVRERDRDQPCISCGIVNPPMKPGGAWDAGHFLSRGAHPELRFDETNCHKQCKGCNGGSGRFAHKAKTVGEDYAANLPARIGVQAFERLTGPHEVMKLDRDTLRQIAVIYRAKTRQLKKDQQ